jgi:hypothetical protein
LNLYSVCADVFDGNQWKLLNRYIEGRTMRKVLIQGIYEGALAMNAQKAKEVYYFTDYETLALKLNDFYDEEKNITIPVTHALYIISMRLAGKPGNLIDEAINKFRQGYRMEFLKNEEK